MNILQVSPPKAGSYWLHTILKNILDKIGLPVSSYIQHHPKFEQLKQKTLSFKEQAAVDMLDIEEEGNHFRVSSIFREKITDMAEYSSRATLAWTHSTYCNRTLQVFQHFQKKVIIVRDPRDRALSAARFAFTPYMREHYPSPYSSSEEFFEAEYERLLEQWVWFYGNYLLHQKELDLHFVFYERLLKDFQNEQNDLLDYLELDLTASEKTEIEKAVSFSNMKEKSPRHLQKGKRRKWVEKLSENQKELATEKAGLLMKLFGYPLQEPQEYSMPGLPQNIPGEALLNRLEKIDWRELYGKPEKASG